MLLPAAVVALAGCSSAAHLRDSGPDADVDAVQLHDADADGDAVQPGDADGEPDRPLTEGPAPGTCWSVAPVDGTLAILEINPAAGEWREVGRRGEGFSECIEGVSLAVTGASLGIAVMPWDVYFVSLDAGTTRSAHVDLFHQLAPLRDARQGSHPV